MYFITQKVDVEFQDIYGNSALFYAVMKDQCDMVDILLKLCKKIKFLNKENKSVYEYVNSSNKRMKELLKNI